MIPHHSFKVIEGPSSRTTLVGPDGSVISSLQPGGKVIADAHATILEHGAPVAAYSVPLAPLVAHEHIATPIVEARAEIVAPATKTVISETAQTVVTHDAPVVAKTVELTPVVHAEEHVAIEAAPVVAAVGAKTSISEHSTSIVHPSPAVAVHAEPVVATRVAAPVVATPVAVAHAAPVAVVHDAPVAVAHAAPVAVASVVGTKTTISEHGSTVVSHSAPAVHAFRTAPAVTPVGFPHIGSIVAEPNFAVAHAAPAVAVAHSAPAVAIETHVAPVAAIGTKTVVSEHGQTVVSHHAPLVKTHVHSLPVAHYW